MDMRENHLGYRETIRKYWHTGSCREKALYMKTLKLGCRYLEEGTERLMTEHRGNKPQELELMIRLYLLQNLYNLSDMGTRNEVIDSRAFSSFCRVSSRNQIPDGDTPGRFRPVPEKNNLQENIFAAVLTKLRTEGKIRKIRNDCGLHNY